MRFGICTGLGSIDEALSAGFDYVEVPLKDLVDAPDLHAYKDRGIETTNLFFPERHRIVGPVFSDYASYAHRALERAALVGVRLAVLGSGGARRAEPYRPEAEAEFLEVAVELDLMGQSFGIRICPESLNGRETNVANDLAILAKHLQKFAVGYAADAYHVIQESFAQGISPDWITQLPLAPSHVHVASESRSIIDPDSTVMQGFRDRLRDLEYKGRISFEGNTSGWTMTQILEPMRKLFQD